MPATETANVNRNLYIAMLPHWVTEDWLRSEFDRFGSIVSCKLLNEGPRGSMRVGFVQYTTPEMAIVAQKAMDQKPVGNSYMSVRFAHRDKDKGIQSMPSNNVYVCNLPPTYRETDLYALFCPYGGITSLIVLEDRKTGRSKCAGLIRYNKVEEACAVIAALNGVGLEGHDRPLEVKFADNCQAKEMRQGKCKGRTGQIVLDQQLPQSPLHVQSAPCSPALTPMTPICDPSFDGKVPSSPQIFALTPVIAPRHICDLQPLAHDLRGTAAGGVPRTAQPLRFAQAPTPSREACPPRVPSALPSPSHRAGGSSAPGRHQLPQPTAAPCLEEVASQSRKCPSSGAWEELSKPANHPPPSSHQRFHPGGVFSTLRLHAESADALQKAVQRPKAGIWESSRCSSSDSCALHSSLESSKSSTELSWGTLASLPCSPLDYMTKLFDPEERFGPRGTPSSVMSSSSSMASLPVDFSPDATGKEHEEDVAVGFDLWAAAAPQNPGQQCVDNESFGQPSSVQSQQEFFGPFQSMLNLKECKRKHLAGLPASIASSPMGSPLLTGLSNGSVPSF